MKSRASELVDKSLAAMVSAIEVYNKPDFKYREEAFSILAANAWELLLKAKWLAIHHNVLKSLYVTESRRKPNGEPYKHPKVKRSSCNNPLTHSLEYLAKKLTEKKLLPEPVRLNLEALREIRDSSVHFYNRDRLFALQLQEVGSAAVKNYVRLSQEWFQVELTKFNFYLMPLAFIGAPQGTEGVTLNREEKNLASFISDLDARSGVEGDYAVTVSVNVQFARSTSGEYMKVQLTNDPNATKVQLTDDQICSKWPYTYQTLTAECKNRYINFVANMGYHEIRKPLKGDVKYCYVRRLDPGNPKSAKQERFSEAVFTVLDRHYTRDR